MVTRSTQLLLRQLKDIQAQADKISTGENSPEAIENFARYAAELKVYIHMNIDSAEVKAYLTELPEINFERTNIKLWQYILLPSWWISLYKEHQAINKAIQEINHVKSKYATLELLIRGLQTEAQ